MPGGSLGTIRGQIRLDVANAIAGYAAVRAANAHTINTMNDARNRMRGFGLAAIGMGAAFLTGFGMAVNAAADFEKKLDYFGAVNNATAEQMEKVREKALELGRTSLYSAGQVADALVEMGKAGVSAEDIIDGMADAMVNLAAAADIDLAQATNIVTSQIQAFSLSAKDAVHVTNLMAGAANASIIDVTDIGVSMKYVAGVAHSLGISIDSTTDAISLLGKAGIKGSTAGTSLRQIMVSLAGGTKKAKGVLRELGIITEDGSNKFFTQAGRAKSLAEVFQILQDHTADLTDKERLMAMRTIFNNRALAAASILTKEGAAGFAEMNAEISKTTAADVAAKRMDNLSGDIRKLKGNFETFLIEGGTPFQEFLRSIVQNITKLVQWFSSLPRGVQTSMFAFMGLGGIVFVVAGTIALFGAAISGAIGAISSVIGAFRMLGPILMTAARATWALTIATLANPYTWLVIAVIALVAAMILLYQRSETFREFIDTIGRAFRDAFNATVEWFKGLPKFFSDVWDSITEFFTKGVDWVVQKWNEMVDFIVSAPGKIWDGIQALGVMVLIFLTGLPEKISNGIQTAWDGFMAFLADLPRRIGHAIGFLIGLFVRFGFEAMQRMQSAGQAIWDALVWFFTELPGEIWKWLQQVWTDFQKWGVDMLAQGIIMATDLYNGIIEWFQKLPGRVWDFLVETKTKLYDGGVQWVAEAIVAAQEVYDGVVDWFRKLPGRIWDYLVETKDNLIRQAALWSIEAWNMGKGIWDGIVDWITGIPDKVGEIVDDAVQAFKDMVGRAAQAARDFAGGLWDGFKDGLGIQSPSYIEEAMWAITRVTGKETERLRGQLRDMQGMARGLQSVHDTASNASAVPDWMRELDVRKKMAMALNPGEGQLGLSSSAAQSERKSGLRDRLEAAEDQRPINITVHNPVAERASDTAARKLRLLSDMGAF